MKVLSICPYLSRWQDEITGEKYDVEQEDWDALKFVHGVKGDKPIKGYATVPVGRQLKRLEQANRLDSHEWFGEILAPRVKALLKPSLKVAVVGVPCSSAVGGAANAVPHALALSLARHLTKLGRTAKAVDALRWKTPQPSTRQGGTRNAVELARNLYVARGVDKDHQVVLVDDVYTSGGHVVAARSVLQQSGVNHVVCAATAGRTTQIVPDYPRWQVPDIELVEDDDEVPF